MGHRICCRSPATPLTLFNNAAMPLQAGFVSLSVVFKPPLIPFFSHWSLFQLNCSSFHYAACFPSVDSLNKSPLLPSHAHESRGEGSNGEFFSPFYFPPFHTFSHSFFFQSNCYPIHSASRPPLSQSREQGPTISIPAPPVALRRWWRWVFPLYIFFSSNFSQGIFVS